MHILGINCNTNSIQASLTVITKATRHSEHAPRTVLVKKLLKKYYKHTTPGKKF
jgi:hypothetical protein